MSAFSVGCLAIGATIGLVAWHYGFRRGVRIGRELEREAELLKPDYWLNRAAQRARDRVAVDSLVGAPTWKGDE